MRNTDQSVNPTPFGHFSQAPTTADLRKEEGTYVLRDFRFRSGEVLPELATHYTTLGTAVRDAQGRVRNAVLVLHGTTGTGSAYLAPNFSDFLFGPGQVLDVSRWYVILPDSIGHGGSSKPSDGLRARFPRYDYYDMVEAQHRLVTQGLDVDHLRLVTGISMGGMHAWIWGHMYPGLMDALLPMVCLPAEIAGRNRMWRRIAMDAIRTDPNWNGGEYKEQPVGLRTAARMMMLAAAGAVDLERSGPTREAADALLDQMSVRLSQFDANDFLYQLDSSRTYNPEGALDSIQAQVIAVNAQDDYINPCELDVMDRHFRRVRRGRYVLLPRTERGHASVADPNLWKQYVEELLNQRTH
jgi:homoserine O-acetyltransferase